MNQYSYKEMRDKALETRSQEDIDALGEWMQLYGMDLWNGEVYDSHEGYSLRPILEASAFEDNGEPYQWDVVGYELC